MHNIIRISILLLLFIGFYQLILALLGLIFLLFLMIWMQATQDWNKETKFELRFHMMRYVNSARMKKMNGQPLNEVEKHLVSRSESRADLSEIWEPNDEDYAYWIKNRPTSSL